MTDRLVIATRGSALALWQAEHVKARIAAVAPDVAVTFNVIKTSGDQILDVPLAKVGGKGLFVKEIEQALLDRTADLAVHSMKDVPPELAPGLVLAAVSAREVPWDALCARTPTTVDTLPRGARVGTSSMRRQCQLLARRPDLEVVDIRGNVDSRLRRVAEGAFDAVVLAAAGLVRLERQDDITEYFDLDEWPVAPGQGALALETREGDERAFASIDDRPSRIMVDAEREVLRLLEAGCSAPIGTHAMIDDGLLFLTAQVYRPDGSDSLTSSHALYLNDSTTPAQDVAQRVAEELLALGAADLADLGGPA